MDKDQQHNYRTFLIANTIQALAGGIFIPFFIIFLFEGTGGLDVFGFAMGLMAFAYAVTSYYIGKYSDKMGRKKLLILSGFVLALVIVLFTFVTSLAGLFLLLALAGIARSVESTLEATYLGDITEKKTRGKNVGKYKAIIGVIAAISMAVGGILVNSLGFEVIFYFTAGMIVISALYMTKLKE